MAWIARALVLVLCTLKGKEKNLLYSLKTSVPLKPGFDSIAYRCLPGAQSDCPLFLPLKAPQG